VIYEEETMAHFVVKHAVYGALAAKDAWSGKAYEVSAALQTLINQGTGVVACSDASFGDPAPGVTKHFGAVVTRDGEDFYFAGQEGDLIDFNHEGGCHRTTTAEVVFAVYGALHGNKSARERCFEVSAILQGLLANNSGTVTINNTSFGGDPAPFAVKHFAAMVKDGANTTYYACQEGQTINFGTGTGTW